MGSAFQAAYGSPWIPPTWYHEATSPSPVWYISSGGGERINRRKDTESDGRHTQGLNVEREHSLVLDEVDYVEAFGWRDTFRPRVRGTGDDQTRTRSGCHGIGTVGLRRKRRSRGLSSMDRRWCIIFVVRHSQAGVFAVYAGLGTGLSKDTSGSPETPREVVLTPGCSDRCVKQPHGDKGRLEECRQTAHPTAKSACQP